jgi:hypothetical protein
MSIVCFGCNNESYVDRTTATIFPLIEERLPLALNQALGEHSRGAWKNDLLSASRVLRLELLQACRPDLSFMQTLREVWQDWLVLGLVAGPPPSSSAIAQARARLPPWALETLFRHSAAQAAAAPEVPSAFGQRLLAIDGAPLTLPARARHRVHFGAPRNQNGEAYFPVAQSVWVSRVLCGQILAQHLGPLRQTDEVVAPYLLKALLQPGDVVLGDAHFGHFPTLSISSAAGAFYLVQAPSGLVLARHVTKRFAPDEALLRLPCTDYIRDKYSTLSLPKYLDLRTVSFDIPARDRPNGTKRAAFLTNLERAQFPVLRVQELGRLRWNHETFNNDIKTRLGLGDMRSQTPEGASRETLAHLCINNLVRQTLKEVFTAKPLEGSFTAALSALRQANQQLRLLPQLKVRIWTVFQQMLHDQPVVSRPGRTEPRLKRPDRRPFQSFRTTRAEWRAWRQAAQLQGGQPREAIYTTTPAETP